MQARSLDFDTPGYSIGAPLGCSGHAVHTALDIGSGQILRVWEKEGSSKGCRTSQTCLPMVSAAVGHIPVKH